MPGSERYYSCVTENESISKDRGSEREAEKRPEAVEHSMNNQMLEDENMKNNQGPKTITKKRPRIKTYAKYVPMINKESMIKIRHNYLKRKETEKELNEREVIEEIEDLEEEKGEEEERIDRSPEAKKKKGETESESNNKCSEGETTTNNYIKEKPVLEYQITEESIPEETNNESKKDDDNSKSEMDIKRNEDKSPVAKKQRREDIETIIWAIEADSAVKSLAALANKFTIK